ncbi:uncharacterized protein F5147DRAFT_650963 [Suillus discolor]|uniref:CxC2-like cysteine cluster KDZ transposase-associated domain-containing protein n=1 Tax=Suillus discolor TaxID=1912936 RepID=A0A9P7FAH7_9AGAM|nr:uncharacterized protein F5147DRAFT_650963 [Suillus discolor]KAG2112328.1 hypothetical protein F5147DRAFT_650963 [Suillus discolor]
MRMESQNDYLQQWQLCTEEYLMLLLDRKAPPVGRACVICEQAGVFRRLPFHHISEWNGTYFEESSLTKAGLEFYLGHGGEPCPSDPDILTSDVFDWVETDDQIDPDNIPPETVMTWVFDMKATTIVDKTGIHSLILRYCQCLNSLSPDRQLFQMGMFPASFTHPKTAFTFAGLDNYLLDNLECGTSAMNHFSNVFPHIVPAEHLHMANPNDGVWLMDGQGFMVGKDQYKLHLDQAKDHIERSDCNNHKAVNLANASRHKLEATGIGGCACAQHGCFVPHSMVDFQKGEWQMNMDYALCQALNYNTAGITRALTFYDVDCQYNKNLRSRVAQSPYLEMPVDINITPGIGLWHVHGHQESCFNQWRDNGNIVVAPEYYLTIGLWHVDSSPKGVLGLPDQAITGCADSNEAFEKLNSTADPALVEEWEMQEADAQTACLHDPKSMDIYDVQLQKGKSPVFSKPGLTMLVTALSREQQELHLLSSQTQRKLGRRPTETQILELAHRRDKLQGDIERWVEAGATFFGQGYDHVETSMDVAFIVNHAPSDDSDIELDYDPISRVSSAGYHPETTVIPMPSNVGIQRCEELGANDALQNIRVSLAEKDILLRTTVRPAKSQARSTRAWAQVWSVDRAVRLNLQELGADELLLKYRPLLKEHLKVTTAVADPNARGQRNDTLAWFWSLDVQGDSTSSDWMNEWFTGFE